MEKRYDRWRWNIFRDDVGTRQIVAIGCVALGLVLWGVFGYDSGIEQAWRFVVTGNWDYAAAVYGRSFHFSALVIYGLLYVGVSTHLARHGVVKTKNVVYSLAAVMLNVAVFELLYMALFNHYQLHRPMLAWLQADFAFLSNYFLLLLLGGYGTLLLAGERLRYRLTPTLWPALLATYTTFLLWIVYPLPTATVTCGRWVSSPLFPQTHYAYVHPRLYVANDLLHTVNLLAKSFVAATHYLLIRGLHR